jgi:hypothetical protein
VLKPVISGSIHSEELSTLIADEATSASGIGPYKKLLLGILNELTSSEFSERKRPGCSTTLWSEIGIVQAARNKLLHQGITAEPAIIGISIPVAETVLNDVLPEILSGFALNMRGSVISKGSPSI